MKSDLCDLLFLENLIEIGIYIFLSVDCQGEKGKSKKKNNRHADYWRQINISPSVPLNNTITNETFGDSDSSRSMSKKTGVGACGRMSRGSAFFTRSNFTILFFHQIRIFSMSPKPIAKRRRMPLSSPTTKNAQLNGSTRPKGSGSSSPTTGAKKSSCTNRT